MSQPKSGLLCRQTTCVGRGLSVEEVLPTSKLSRTKLTFPAFLRKFSLTKQQEKIVPGCANV
ncbi:unnamed protein product [Coregonus sp. 'balchen']|nr:unnamed protein product [Coregonus sp. 'balchen']